MHIDEIARDQIIALDRRLTEQTTAQERANGIALAAAEKAVLKAEAASEKRFEGLNEFRQMLSDQAGTFIRRTEVEAIASSLSDAIARLERQDGNSVGRGAGADYAWRVILAIIGLLLGGGVILVGLRK